MSCDNLQSNRFGFGSGIHAMDDVSCTGEEPHILSCSYDELGGVHNCAIYESTLSPFNLSSCGCSALSKLLVILLKLADRHLTTQATQHTG